jgi:hypothetical protein
MSTMTTVDLPKRGNYSMLRLQSFTPQAQGITTRRLLDQIDSHATYTKKVIDRAERGLHAARRRRATWPWAIPACL